jgi:hypothetical protein
MENLVPEGYEVLKLLKISERGSNQLRYQNRLFKLKNPSKDLWRCITPKCGVALKLLLDENGMNAKEPLEIAKPPHKEHCIACEMMEESEFFYKEIRSEAKSNQVRRTVTFMRQ